jgi:hypothetical protein
MATEVVQNQEDLLFSSASGHFLPFYVRNVGVCSVFLVSVGGMGSAAVVLLQIYESCFLFYCCLLEEFGRVMFSFAVTGFYAA